MKNIDDLADDDNYIDDNVSDDENFKLSFSENVL